MRGRSQRSAFSAGRRSPAASMPVNGERVSRGCNVSADIEVILMKQVASYLAMPIFVVDPSGTLLFYNEPAETSRSRRWTACAITSR